MQLTNKKTNPKYILYIEFHNIVYIDLFYIL